MSEDNVELQAVDKLLSVIRNFKDKTPVLNSEFTNLFYSRCAHAVNFLLYSKNIFTECSVTVTKLGIPVIIAEHPFFKLTFYYSPAYRGITLMAIHGGNVLDTTYEKTFEAFSNDPFTLIKLIDKRIEIANFSRVERQQEQEERESLEEYYGMDNEYYTRAFRD